MSDISKINVGSETYDIRDDIARQHSINTANPHSTTPTQIGLGKVQNLSPSELLNQMTKENVTGALGYIAANETAVTEIRATAHQAELDATEAKNAAAAKIDRNIDSDALGIINFVNGIKVAGVPINYNEASSTFTFG